MNIYPAIDLVDGKAVRLYKGDYAQMTVYSEDPVEFGEVSGHRVLIKRGPGNQGASQRGSTQEATSGMSS